MEEQDKELNEIFEEAFKAKEDCYVDIELKKTKLILFLHRLHIYKFSFCI